MGTRGVRVWQVIFSSFLILSCGSDFEPSSSNPKEDAGSDAGSSGSGASGGSGGSGGSSATGGTSGTGGDASASCPGDHRCAPAAPSDWSGPFALSADATCAGSFATEELVVHSDLNAPAADCDCNCTPATQCPTAAAYRSYQGAGCTNTGGSTTNLAFNTCKAAPATPSASVLLPLATSTCSAVVAKIVPEATWNVTHRLCNGAPSGGSCADTTESCLPKDGGNLCIYHADDTDCPTAYPEKVAYFTSISDTRDCPAACGCVAGGTPECSASIFTWAGSCTGTPLSSSTLLSGGVNACVATATMVYAPTVSKVGTCSGDTLTPLGTATATGAMTVCCLAQ